MYKEIKGDLIKLALEGKFDVIVHGCNCFCTMGAGIAPQMDKHFGCGKYLLEGSSYKGDINKLGTIDGQKRSINIAIPGSLSVIPRTKIITVLNLYTQYHYGKNHIDGVSIPLDYEALTLCMRKINHLFKGQNIGLPQIGCGLAGGNWEIVKEIIKKELNDCQITVVIYEKS
jgi:O-acetyl-ADP-ribose deacetylase (regulator of RNase III)